MSEGFRPALSPRAFLASYSGVCSLIQDDVLAGNPRHEPASQHEQNLFVVDLLDHCDSVTYHHHAVTLFQGALLLAEDVVNDRSIRVSCAARNRQFSPVGDAGLSTPSVLQCADLSRGGTLRVTAPLPMMTTGGNHDGEPSSCATWN